MKPSTYTIIVVPLFLASLAFAVARDAGKANETLLRGTSAFEDMVDPALAKDDAGIAKALAAAEGQAAGVKEALGASASGQYDRLVEAIRKGAAGKEYQAVAMNAVEVFRLLVDNVEAKGLKVPKEVSLLDYAGFRLRVLAAAPEADWVAMRKTVDDAARWWGAIESKVAEKGLRDAFNSTIGGLQQAGKSENLPMLRFAAQIDLDLVDLLEGVFERKK